MLCELCDKRKVIMTIDIAGTELHVCDFCHNILYGENWRYLFGGMIYQLLQKKVELKNVPKKLVKIK